MLNEAAKPLFTRLGPEFTFVGNFVHNDTHYDGYVNQDDGTVVAHFSDSDTAVISLRLSLVMRSLHELLLPVAETFAQQWEQANDVAACDSDKTQGSASYEH